MFLVLHSARLKSVSSISLNISDCKKKTDRKHNKIISNQLKHVDCGQKWYFAFIVIQYVFQEMTIDKLRWGRLLTYLVTEEIIQTPTDLQAQPFAEYVHV